VSAKKKKNRAKPFSSAGDQVGTHGRNHDDLGEKVSGHLRLYGLQLLLDQVYRLLEIQRYFSQLEISS
jgi:hypothetical protein